MKLCYMMDWPVKTGPRASTRVPGLCPMLPWQTLPQKNSMTPTSIVAGINVTPTIRMGLNHTADKSAVEMCFNSRFMRPQDKGR